MADDPDWFQKKETALLNQVKPMAQRIGAKGVYIIGFFDNPDGKMQVISGGMSPVPLPALFKQLQEMFENPQLQVPPDAKRN